MLQPALSQCVPCCAVLIAHMQEDKVGDGKVYSQWSLLRVARLLSSPYGKEVPHARPLMHFEHSIQILCSLLAKKHAAVGDVLCVG